MFSVKATYNGEIRKFSFPDTTAFPTFEQLYSQLNRVFPSSNHCYFSKLLFFPDASKPGRILIGNQVHNAEEYNKCIVAFRGRSWANASLRFSLTDERTHAGQDHYLSQTVGQLPWAGALHDTAGISDPASRATTNPWPVFTPSSPVQFTVPPRAFSQNPVDTELLINVSNQSSAPHNQGFVFDSISSLNEANPKPPTCCSTAQVKSDLQSLLKTFQRDLDQVMDRLSASDVSDTPKAVTTLEPRPSSSFRPIVCSSCRSPATSPCFPCNDCSDIVCSQCKLRDTPTICIASGGRHALRPSLSTVPPLFQDSPSPIRVQASPSPLSFESPFIPPLPHLNFAPVSQPSFMPPPPSSPPRDAPVNQATVACAPPPPPVIHRGVICDSCNLIIEGVRHKCLDCPDFDLCTLCISTGAHERHNSRHQLLDIVEPGRVVVHTVNLPEDDIQRAESMSTPVQPPGIPVVHNATCDLCDSIITGARYKCAACPDFDTCGLCFAITEEQHPHHSFVKISKDEDYILRGRALQRRHFARCDVCDKPIEGVRYKCMHRDCPDFDLCERCEALPISQHPDNHPLLKMRSADTAIPTVYRSLEGMRYSNQANGYPSIHTPLGGDAVRPHSPRPLGTATEVEPETMPALSGSLTEYGSPYRSTSPDLPGPRTSAPAALSSDILSLGQWPGPINYSLYPLSDHSPRRSTWTESAIESSCDEVQAASDEPPTAPTSLPGQAEYEIGHVSSLSPLIQTTPESLDNINVTSAAPESWYGAGVNNVLNNPLAEPPTPHTVEQSSESSSTIPESPDNIDVTAAVPGSWYGAGLNNLLNNPLAEPPTPHTVEKSSESSSQVVAADSLHDEVLLNRPSALGSSEMRQIFASDRFSLTEHLKGHHSMSSLTLDDPEESPKSSSPDVTEGPLSAGYIEDITAPDGQVFVAGATFIKVWLMANTGTRDWPTNTEVVFVGGAQLASGGSPPHVQPMYIVGPLKPGEEKNVWTPELKAPDLPGRYTSYWRLRDDKGELFGDNIWVDIEVINSASSGPDKALTSSSIIMPDPTSPPLLSPIPNEEVLPRSPTVDTEDNSDDYLSDSSSVSLVSVTSSEDEADATLWAESRAQGRAQDHQAQETADYVAEHATQAMDYVLLYDDNTSEEE